MKTLKILGSLSAILLIIYVFYKNCKKEVKKLEEAEKKTNAELKELGIPVKKLEKEMIPGLDDDNLVKTMFISMEFSDKIDSSFIDPDKAIDSEKVIHVRQTTDTKTKRQRLNFTLEIPTDYISSTKGNYNSPRLPDFIRCSKDAALYMSDNFVKFAERPRTSLEGYFVFEYRYADMPEDEFYYTSARIPECFYSRFAKDGHDGLSEYIEYLNTSRGGTKEEVQEITSYLFCNTGSREIGKINLVDAILYFNISFEIQDNIEPTGINLKTGLDCLNWLIDPENGFKVTRGNKGNSREEFKYEHILFHAPDDSKYKKWSLLWYYTTDDPENRSASRRVISKDFTY